MKKKVIHILCHTAPNTKEHIYYGWPAVTARYIAKYSSDYEQECFYTVTSIKEEKVWEQDGIKYHLFPAWTLNKGLESFLGVIFSPSLIRQLRKIAKNRKNIIHIQGERSLLIWQIIQQVKNNPIYMQFHGYRTPDFLLLFEKLFITPFEKHYFKFIKHFFLPMKNRVGYLINNCNISRKKITLQNVGVDYDHFKLQNKISAKLKLNLPLDKTIFLFVGRFDDVKGVKEITEAHTSIKNKYNTYLILIGGAKDNKHYDYVKKTADLVIPRVNNNQLVPYFNSADVYCMLCPPKKAGMSGMGVAPCEALACGIPLLSSNLIEAPEKIQKKIGLQVSNREELEKGMIYMIKNKHRFKNIRNLTKPYYSWEMVTNNIFKAYNQ